MNWFYVEAGQQRGPVADGEFDQLVASGHIGGETLVWREGMANWQPLREARPDLAAASAPAGGPAAAVVVGTGPEVVCAECNRIFAKDQTIQYGDVYVCANCKPLFVQKLKEGATLPGTHALVYGGFWIRFVAYFLDQIILGLAGAVIGMIVGVSMPGNTPEVVIARQVIAMIVGLALGFSYTVFFLGKFGATPGKMACRLKVMNPDGSPISYGKACGRYFAVILSSLTCTIGYIIAAFDEEKRALHDRICNTRVVKQ
jgi:uncharacterized RDD family membrane protein YckC